ncbi:hypothetical protein [Flavobacterium sp.]|uniref:hypothetical protein n=1 Tax=Flavobacterium sp. TaxID=239 RepID=UPI002B4B136B|nr:hypothetical protein [Flavobacterium sp.]HLF53529.1 hypothetical protein [Flavobacterium sp.]
MKLFQDNTSIECLAADIVSRKIQPSSYMAIRNVGKCFVYKCYRNSEAVITKELDPKEPKHNTHSSLELHDKVEGENLVVAIETKRAPKISLINHTGTHKAQACSTDNYTFAYISKQIPNMPQAVPPKVIEAVKEVNLLGKNKE